MLVFEMDAKQALLEALRRLEGLQLLQEGLALRYDEHHTQNAYHTYHTNRATAYANAADLVSGLLEQVNNG